MRNLENDQFLIVLHIVRRTLYRIIDYRCTWRMRETDLIAEEEKFFKDMRRGTEYRLTHQRIGIRELDQFYRNDRLILRPEYQRTAVWNIKKNRRLIDSILRKYDISTIFLREVIERKTGIQRFECIDGQQRLQCIFDFVDNKFDITPDTTPELEHKYLYEHLSPYAQSEILNYPINSMVVSGANSDIIIEMFMRLQEGVRLNYPEKLNAERSKMRKAVIEISEHKFFPATRLKNVRFSYLYYAAQMLALTLEPKITDVGYNNLKDTYDKFRKGFPGPVTDKTNRSLASLMNILKNRLSVVGSKSDILVLHLIASQLLSKYSIQGFEDRIGDFIIDFIGRVSRQSRLAHAQSKNPYLRYAYFRRYAFLHIQEKYGIMASELLKYIPDMKPVDSRRLFDENQRVAIYSRGMGKCEKCLKTSSFKDGDADHRIRHTDGGLTTVENGRWLCKSCHKVVHGGKNP